MTTLYLPTTLEAALDETRKLRKGPRALVRAGGTDLQDRRHLGIAPGPIVDLRDVPGLDAIELDKGGMKIGAKISVAALAADAGLRQFYPALTMAAGALATPQIRAVATLGGNIMQAPRCWYLRNPSYRCMRSGGEGCNARGGDHLWHVCFDTSPCAAPHASTIGMALMTYDAEVDVMVPGFEAPERLPIFDVLEYEGLPPGAVITAVALGPAVAEERAAYVRASSRERAEWALVEVSARAVIQGGRFAMIKIAAGAVAPTPLRLDAVERELEWRPTTSATIAAAVAKAREGASPLPMTDYKLDLLEACVEAAIEQLLSDNPSEPAGQP